LGKKVTQTDANFEQSGEEQMKHSAAWLIGLALVSGMLVVGCQKATEPSETAAPSGVTNEQQAMEFYAQSDQFVQNDEVTFADNALQPMDYGTFGKVDAAVTPLRWGRFITSVQTNISSTVQAGDSITVVHVQKTLQGILKLKAVTGTGDTATIQKPFTDTSSRNVIFKRVDRNPKRFWLNWIPVASSLVQGGTLPPNHFITITKLEVMTSGDTTLTITDPTNYYLRYNWLKLFNGGRCDVPQIQAGQPFKVQVTLISNSPDTDIVALRYGFSGFQHRRVHLTLVSEQKNADNTYTRVFETSATNAVYMHFFRGYFNLGIDALTRATLYDDTAPYSVSWWGVPYRVL
jgi:hypothetical protein